jgi:hypothetical protein
MSQLASTIEEQVRGRATPEKIFRVNAARETALSRLLMLYIGSGLFFMLLPGTFLARLYRVSGSKSTYLA